MARIIVHDEALVLQECHYLISTRKGIWIFFNRSLAQLDTYQKFIDYLGLIVIFTF
jgi:hypothetical protein